MAQTWLNGQLVDDAAAAEDQRVLRHLQRDPGVLLDQDNCQRVLGK